LGFLAGALLPTYLVINQNLLGHPDNINRGITRAVKATKGLDRESYLEGEKKKVGGTAQVPRLATGGSGRRAIEKSKKDRNAFWEGENARCVTKTGAYSDGIRAGIASAEKEETKRVDAIASEDSLRKETRVLRTTWLPGLSSSATVRGE